MKDSFIMLASLSERRYNELVLEFEEKLDRSLSENERDFIEYLVERQLTEQKYII
ncbi:hypothetical protein [Guptibacillus algicola]|uniref:hypothetical protein n=1 Tax=Guptibacillus algicola TaxID=225844 RepID=UPI001CD5FBA8|nr:hypothetical protein [Alkalihalobacillus algicola]MCA0986881.1 hypothetical protein [Alkalihalobacillus algicola]